MFPNRKLRTILAVTAAILISLSLPSLAWAGGWAVVTLDRLPENVIAGQPYAIGFMVRQHGRAPLQLEQMTVLARQPETSLSETFIATPGGEPGHYQAELLFSEPGAWEWSIQSGLFPEGQPMPVLQVSGAASANTAGEAAVFAPAAVVANAAAEAGAPAGKTAAGLPGSLIGLAALLSLAGGAVLLARSRASGPRALAGAGLLILCGGLAFAFFSSVTAAGTAAPPASSAPGDAGPSAAGPTAAGPTAAEVGQDLFLAKGCVVCHVNTRAIQNAEQYGVSSGPNLTTYRNDPQYLRKFLADPSAVKPTTQMPALNLSAAEIDALVAFINQAED